MSLLPRFARGLRLPLQVSDSPKTLVWSLRRWIYSPTLNPPPKTGPALQGQFRESSAPYLEHEQFRQIAHPPANSGYANLFNEKKKDTVWISQRPEEIWNNKSPRPDTIFPPPNHFAGRSMRVRQDGVGAAYIRLQGILKQNKIRHELRLTERHEKKGVKRRRLRSERWKRKFADEVRKKVKLVNEIRLRDRMWGSGRH